ncbi:AAA family ATPase [Microbacterium sp.]|uniref:AAA family ATPase n=1 Tax=Microbacterium sp. TaxID=51671 RepID=UPI0039E385ED
MKLHRLELTGFGPFRQEQTVDFDAYDADGLFLISGRTGAGKSSILDGVSFALYGSVPRYDGGEKRLRSDHCHPTDPTEVRLEFTVGGTRWRVTRAPEYDRPAKRGGGLTTEVARAELEEWVDGAWAGRAAKPRTVGELLGGVLGLNAQQFQQVILLAQNKFSTFLLAPGSDRQALLRTLFGTRRFERYRDDLDRRRLEAQRAMDAVSTRAQTLLDQAERLVGEAEPGEGEAGETGAATGDATGTATGGDATGDATGRGTDLAARRETMTLALQRAQFRVAQAETASVRAGAAYAAAVAAHTEAAARAQRAAELAAARTRLAELERRAPEVAAGRLRLERARAAAAVRAPLEAASRAGAARDAAARVVDDAERAWAGRRGAAGVAGDADIEAVLDALTGNLARWQAAAAQERELIDVEATGESLARRVDEVSAALAALAQQQELIPAERIRIESALTVADEARARRDDLRRARDELTAALTAAREAEDLRRQARVADETYARAGEAAREARAVVDALVRRRLAGYAGELSSALVDGEPCAVCGSTAHPHPAAPADDAVTPDAIDAAEAARDTATETERTAGDAARAAQQRLGAARERAGGRSADELDGLRTGLDRDLAAADAAATEAQRLRTRRDELDRLGAAADAERAAQTTLLAGLREQHAACAADAARLRGAVDAARGDHGSVAERVAAVTADRDRARALADARAALAEAERVRAAALADRDARLASSPFAVPEDGRQVPEDAPAAADRSAAERAATDAAASLLPDDEVRTLDADLAQHLADLTATRARLLELDAEDTEAPGTAHAAAEPPDPDAALAASEVAVASADAARAAAIAARRDAENTAARLRDLLVQADDACAVVAEAAAAAAVVTRLSDTVAGRAPNTMKMDLETFVLAAELEEIVAAANVRLAEMSSGRYTLHHSDARASRGRASGLGIDVLDAHTGRLRSPDSLSGGETFLASLALALGLGEVVTSRAGGIRLDTLFVDEGFGALDPETLELAMRTLDELRAGGRSVGVISHVEAMKEQLPAQLVVEATPEGPSIIRDRAH